MRQPFSFLLHICFLSMLSLSAQATDKIAGAPSPMIGGIIESSDVSASHITQPCAVDSEGNRYVVGSCYFNEDFNPFAGTDIVVQNTYMGNTLIFGSVTRFNADGSYGWTQTFSSHTGDAYCYSVLVNNGVAYVAGQCGDRFLDRQCRTHFGLQRRQQKRPRRLRRGT
jgi:hypothetical protein